MDLRNERGIIDYTDSPDICLSQRSENGVISSISALCNTGPQVSANGKMESLVQSSLNKLEPSFHGVVECAPLTNRERLLLRKQALKTRKHAVLAIASNWWSSSLPGAQ